MASIQSRRPKYTCKPGFSPPPITIPPSHIDWSESLSEDMLHVLSPMVGMDFFGPQRIRGDNPNLPMENDLSHFRFSIKDPLDDVDRYCKWIAYTVTIGSLAFWWVFRC